MHGVPLRFGVSDLLLGWWTPRFMRSGHGPSLHATRRVRAKSIALTEFAIELSDRLLAPFGVVLATPRDPAERRSHVLLAHPAFQSVTARLWERGVIPDFRPPDGLRLGLSRLSTSYAELLRGIVAMREVLLQVSTEA